MWRYWIRRSRNDSKCGSRRSRWGIEGKSLRFINNVYYNDNESRIEKRRWYWWHLESTFKQSKIHRNCFFFYLLLVKNINVICTVNFRNHYSSHEWSTTCYSSSLSSLLCWTWFSVWLLTLLPTSGPKSSRRSWYWKTLASSVDWIVRLLTTRPYRSKSTSSTSTTCGTICTLSYWWGSKIQRTLPGPSRTSTWWSR